MDLDRFDAVSLPELDARAALQSRIDRKYLLTPAQTARVIEGLPPGTRALEAEGRRRFAYASFYLDTPDLACFKLSAHRRRRRFKLRTRVYRDTGEAWFEVKTRGPRGRTVKDRLALPRPVPEGPAFDFAARVLAGRGVAPPALGGFGDVLAVRFHRSTLLVPARGGYSRVTVDRDLEWQAPDGPVVAVPELAVLETKSPSGATPADAILWSGGRRPDRVSKFAAGLALTRPEVSPGRWRKAVALLAAGALAASLTACSGAGADSSADIPASVAEAVADKLESHYSAADLEWDRAGEVEVALTGATAESESAGVEVDGGAVTLTEEGTYRISGGLDDGRIVVDAPAGAVVRLVLDGATIASSTGPALDLESAERVVLLTEAGTQNSLTDAQAYAREDPEATEPDAAVFSRVNLTLGGGGALEVTGRAGDGIASKDGIVIVGGTLSVTAEDDAVRGKDYLILSEGALQLTAGGDGLKSTGADDPAVGYVLVEGGSATVDAGTDCVDAAGDALISGGELSLTCGDDGVHAEAVGMVDGGSVDIVESVEGFEAVDVVVAGGRLDIVASDDGINAAGGEAATEGEPAMEGEPGGGDWGSGRDAGGLPHGYADGFPE